MENIENAPKNSHRLLDILMDSMPKTPDKAPVEREIRGDGASAPETVKNEAQGEKVDLLA